MDHIFNLFQSGMVVPLTKMFTVTFAMNVLNQNLKGQCQEIFDFWFFS
jgi:hypothetical protein